MINEHFRHLMQKATRLTGTGKLRAATAAIQAALRGGPEAEPEQRRPSPDVVDAPVRELPPYVTRSPDGAPQGEERFVAGRFGSDGAQRDYKLFIPPGAGSRPLPLVVMLHGCTQNPDDFAAGTAMNEVARAQGFYVLYPAQSHKANAQGCWNWFKHNHQQRGRGEPALLAGMTRQVMAEHAIDPDRVYVAGLSAGGAMAAILGAAYPELYAAVGVHSGLAAGSANDLPSALAAMKRGAAARAAAHGVPTIVFHGDADGTVHPANGDQVMAACAGAASEVATHKVSGAGGRTSTRSVHSDPADGRVLGEHWLVHGASHAWSGGSSRGSYTDSRGPDATAEMLRFFFEHPRRTVQ